MDHTPSEEDMRARRAVRAAQNALAAQSILTTGRATPASQVTQRISPLHYLTDGPRPFEVRETSNGAIHCIPLGLSQVLLRIGVTAPLENNKDLQAQIGRAIFAHYIQVVSDLNKVFSGTVIKLVMSEAGELFALLNLPEAVSKDDLVQQGYTGSGVVLNPLKTITRLLHEPHVSQHWALLLGIQNPNLIAILGDALRTVHF